MLDDLLKQPVATSAEQRKIAKAYRVPYWVISSDPRPSWLRSPLWRLRAFVWSRR